MTKKILIFKGKDPDYVVPVKPPSIFDPNFFGDKRNASAKCSPGQSIWVKDPSKHPIVLNRMKPVKESSEITDMKILTKIFSDALEGVKNIEED